MPTDPERLLPRGIQFATVGPFSTSFATDVVAGVSGALVVPCRLQREPPAVELSAHELEGRGQIDADRMLTALEKLPLPAGEVLVALIERDIGHPIFTFFFGRARHHGRAAIVSIARLDPRFYGLPEDYAATLRRTRLEAIHELGHVAGLAHCKDFGCIMRFSASVEGIDNRGTTLCETCRREPGAAMFRVRPERLAR